MNKPTYQCSITEGSPSTYGVNCPNCQMTNWVNFGDFKNTRLRKCFNDNSEKNNGCGCDFYITSSIIIKHEAHKIILNEQDSE